MRILVAGFITIDTIQLPIRSITTIGGPPCYAGLLCSRFGMDVSVMTKVGPDFPDEQAVWLARNGIVLGSAHRSLTKGTTRFRIETKAPSRELTLLNRCEDISKEQLPGVRVNASLVSPIAGEISPSLLAEISARSDFTFLDPQGFVRAFDSRGNVSVREPKDRSILTKVDAVKMDREEAEALTGRVSPRDSLQKLSALGLRKAVVTQGSNECYVLDGTRIYEIQVPKAQVVDQTGAGDILGGAIVSMYLRTRDFLRSACFGIAASSLSLHMIALSKVDLPMSVDETAMRLYSQATPVASV
ncbi:MAG TPA: PfkB family carbohydrate kinase [Nitrososphaerales archaeon]|nr:PfkB family carbohydrate kinase [Nitrososphaerales archaeon]